MTVYADVLICINIIIDYLILELTVKLLKTQCSFWRQLLGSVVGGAFSLFILLPDRGVFLSLAIRLITAFAVVAVSFGFGSMSLLIRRVCSFFVISFAFSGTMFAVWYFIKPTGLMVHNGIVYYNLSSIVLIITAIFTYCIITLISRFIRRKNIHTCRLMIETDRTALEVTALVDSGNKLREPFSEKPVVLLDPKYQFMLEGYHSRERVIPYNTVSNSGTVMGIVPKAVYILEENSKESLDVYLAISPSPLQDFGAIIGTDAL